MFYKETVQIRNSLRKRIPIYNVENVLREIKKLEKLSVKSFIEKIYED